MAAPTTPLLSTFTGTENPLSESGAWTSPTQLGADKMTKTGGVAVGVSPAVTSTPSAYWTSTFGGTDQECYTQSIPTLPIAGSGVGLTARILNPASASESYYNFVWINGTGYQLYRNNSDTFTQLGSTVTTHTHQAGEGMWLSVSGTGATVTVTGYYLASGVWTQIIQSADSTGSRLTTTPSNIGFFSDNNSPTFDDFGGGPPAVTVANAPRSFSTIPVQAQGRNL